MMVVPLRIGGGSRLKILEAMAAGLPVVSTQVGAEGLELLPDRDFISADDSVDLANALIACIRDPHSAHTMAKRVRTVVLARHDWEFLADRLEHVWMACVAGECNALPAFQNADTGESLCH
jgi:glycosyltransferase involved in cell wall biosynthesis